MTALLDQEQLSRNSYLLLDQEQISRNSYLPRLINIDSKINENKYKSYVIANLLFMFYNLITILDIMCRKNVAYFNLLIKIVYFFKFIQFNL